MVRKEDVKNAIESARVLLAQFEYLYPNDKRPRWAIETAERWLEDPTKYRRTEEPFWAAKAARMAAGMADVGNAKIAAKSAAWAAESTYIPSDERNPKEEIDTEIISQKYGATPHRVTYLRIKKSKPNKLKRKSTKCKCKK